MSRDNPWSGPVLEYGGEAYDISVLEQEQPEESRNPSLSTQPRLYVDGKSIDWLHEESAERERQHRLQSLHGISGLLKLILVSARMWFVIIATGAGVGISGAWLDVLAKWLGDVRTGRCSYGIFYNSVTCCSGLDPGETCTQWQTWSGYLNVQSMLGQSLLQALVYIALGVAFAASAAVLVDAYAPYAFHTGIPEIKAILGGYVLDAFLSPWTLCIKFLGLALAVASGLSLGKEGPLVHVACCMAHNLSRIFKGLRQNEAQKRQILAAAAAAGISVAFGSPLGGVLFGLEELDTFSKEADVMWKGFVISVIAAVSLQYVDPFGTKKLVLFEVTGFSDTWRAFELLPWITLSVIGGVLGSMLIKLNVWVAVYRKNSNLKLWPILEVVGASAVTAAVSYLVVFLRVQSSELVANLFIECDSTKGDYHGLCNPTALWRNIFLLTLTALVKFLFTSWTFGMMVPAGIFLPTIAIGASLGRAMGLLTQGLHRLWPKAWIFNSCPPDPTLRCISPGFYAVIGASAMLGGVTRMTISLVVILFELTGALSHVLPIMISVMVSKWVADAFGKEGIYPTWIALRNLPWLPPHEYRDKTEEETTFSVMKPLESLVVIQGIRCTLRDLNEIVRTHDFYGFPVVHGDNLLGYVARDRLQAAIEPLIAAESPPGGGSTECTFSATYASESGLVNLAPLMDTSVLQLRKEVPLELVVNMIHKMNLRHILFTQGGKLTGLTTKSDIVQLLTAHLPHRAALNED